MDAIAGIAIGILLSTARTLSPEQQAGVARAVQALFFHPIVGGELSVFSVLGSLGGERSRIALVAEIVGSELPS